MSNRSPRALWRPSEALRTECGLSDYHRWLNGRGEATEVDLGDYEALWRWSCADVDGFWRGLLDYFELAREGSPGPARARAGLIDPGWFAGLRLNYAEHVLRQATPDRPAFVTVREDRGVVEHAWSELTAEVAALQAVLAEAGIGPGDRVVAFLPNTEHAVVGFLATAGLGAVWSSCSPDFGADAVLDRFRQVAPKALIACRGYGYGGRYQDRTAVAERLATELGTLSLKLLVDTAGQGSLAGWRDWATLSRVATAPQTVRVSFEHPLWILYSSGTTGQPKAIVHGHGGCLLEHCKYLSLQADVRPGERFFWYTTTGWMMWNFLQASMLVGAVPVFYDGSAGFPSLRRLWILAAELPIHHFGTSAPFLHACMRLQLDVGAALDLSALRSIGSTGAPLSPEGFAYVYSAVKSDVWLSSMSGGTDVCTAFVGGNPWRPVHEGWIQGRALGCDLHAYGGDSHPVVGAEGELVVRQPMPSMPVAFWDDPGDVRRRESYFEDVPGVWRHGDWITVNTAGEVTIHGRSDATLNRQGVRIGTAEIYRYLDRVPEVTDGLIVNYVDADGTDHMPLFVVLTEGVEWGAGLRQNLLSGIRSTLSPRHVPTRIEAVSEIPYTISGKRLETPVKRLFEGRDVDVVAKRGSLRNPGALDRFAHLAASRRAPQGEGGT